MSKTHPTFDEAMVALKIVENYINMNGCTVESDFGNFNGNFDWTKLTIVQDKHWENEM